MKPRIRALVLCLSLATLAPVLSCGPTTIEPVPDIPQTVEYDTVKIDYAGEDGVEQPQSGTLHGALVGETSELATFTRETVFGTNQLMFRIFESIDTITEFPARRPRTNQWLWETGPNADEYLYFRIDGVDDDTFEYTLRVGTSAQDSHEIFRGWFTPFDTAAQAEEQEAEEQETQGQQGEGLLHIDFDALHAHDPSSAQGKMAIAFRSRNQVRQVRVGFDQFTDGENEPLNAIYRYVELPSQRGRFVFFGRGDFSKDGEPYEFLSVESAWLADRQGRVAARVENGSLDQPYTVRQCWDASETIVWEESQPARPLHDGGSTDQCAASLRGLRIDAPSYEPPNGEDPEVPSAHPAE